MNKLLPSQNPPADLKVEDVPMFVTMGFDDNGHSGLISPEKIEGMNWASTFFSSLKNSGDGNEKTFDKTNGSCSFYYTTQYISGESEEPAKLVRESWFNAVKAGHGIGCHTDHHYEGGEFSKDQWKNEIETCLDKLTTPYSTEDNTTAGVGAKREDIIGFRTPFLEYNDNTFKAVKDAGFIYDCSIEEGFAIDQDGRNFYWPYTLDEGAPGNIYSSAIESDLEKVSPQKGLWEFPAYAIITPPDDLCEKYGVESGFRDRIKLRDEEDCFSVLDGKITGFDYNALVSFKMNKQEWLATLKYTLDLRLDGNRAPMLYGGHTDVYADGYDICPNITVEERREVLEAFFTYAISKPEVRVVKIEDILEWMKSPVKLGSQ